MLNKSVYIVTFFLVFVSTNLYAGNFFGLSVETDRPSIQLTSFFDLRDRESYIQLTNTFSTQVTAHIQIFDVSNNCNENNFYDVYTPNDTHVYNMRDILSNDGNPSGVILPDNAYGFVVATSVDPNDGFFPETNTSDYSLIGNFRIIDVNGYEYRTNSTGWLAENVNITPNNYYFNFNNESGVTLSDVVGISFGNAGDSDEVEVIADSVEQFIAYDIDIFDLNEVPFSCRNVIFSCIDQDNPRLEELLVNSGDASVASFEYGINEAIPHSKDGELLCPGNVIDDGWVILNIIGTGDFNEGGSIFGFIGLNNGNGRGSMDSWWSDNVEVIPAQQ